MVAIQSRVFPIHVLCFDFPAITQAVAYAISNSLAFALGTFVAQATTIGAHKECWIPTGPRIRLL